MTACELPLLVGDHSCVSSRQLTVFREKTKKNNTIIPDTVANQLVKTAKHLAAFGERIFISDHFASLVLFVHHVSLNVIADRQTFVFIGRKI